MRSGFNRNDFLEAVAGANAAKAHFVLHGGPSTVLIDYMFWNATVEPLTV
jgi:hypothetical protein